MSVSAKVDILNQIKYKQKADGHVLCFQKCEIHYSTEKPEVGHVGYRFAWLKDNGTLQVTRGQAILPSINIAIQLINDAIKEGWADIDINVDDFVKQVDEI